MTRRKRLLDRQRQLADFVEEQGPLVGLLDQPFLADVGPGERSAHMPEKNAFHERFRQRRAVDDHKIALGPPAV